MASSVGGQDEPNPALRMVTRVGKMALSYPLLTAENGVLFPYEVHINQAWSIKVAGC